jgi:hypothetical protein
MSRLIQSLESRTFFSATSAEAVVLLGDVKQVTASAATVRADLRSAVSVGTTGLNKVATDLKTSTDKANRASNAALLRTVRSGELTTFATLRGDQTALLVVGASLSARSAADARALLLHPTNLTIQARVTADITALTTEPAARLATFQAAAQVDLIGAALTNLVDANPSNTALAGDASDFQNGGAAVVAIGNVITAAGSFTVTISVLNTDVNSTTSGSTIPNLVGTYEGQVTDGSHNQGLPSNWTLDITAEGTDGSFSGTITTTANGNTTSQTESITGSVTASGSFTLTAFDPTTNQVGGSLTGTLSGTTLLGTFDDGMGGTGPFSLVKQ